MGETPKASGKLLKAPAQSPPSGLISATAPPPWICEQCGTLLCGLWSVCGAVPQQWSHGVYMGFIPSYRVYGELTPSNGAGGQPLAVGLWGVCRAVPW